MEMLFYLWFFLGLLFIGFMFGQIAEKRHFKSIREREKLLHDIMVFSDRQIPEQYTAGGRLVMGSVVLSKDYFQGIVAGLRNFIGGNIRGYETLLLRARREAVLRMKEEAKALGSDRVFNIKFETSSISKGNSGMITVEVLVYGTAVA